MPASYEVVVIHSDLDEFAAEFRNAVREAAEIVLQQPGFLTFGNSVSDASSDSNVLVVYLGSKLGHSDGRVADNLDKALYSRLPILPVVRDSDPGSIHQKLPPAIARINAVNWTIERASALTAVLRTLGLAESERKVFLSYMRTDTTPMAIQLHTALVQRQFDVFLDRFSVPPGVDFQERLDEDLCDKAFVVLLESSNLRDSRWVQHEISYAHSHRIDLLAVTMPSVADADLVPAIDDAFRIRLAEDDLEEDGETLSERSRDVILGRIEVAHARSVRRRREQLVGSLTDSLLRDGCNCDSVEEWSVLATARDRRPAVFFVTARRPQPEDLRTLHFVCGRVTEHLGIHDVSASVAHDVEHVTEQHRGLLEWVAEPRSLDVKRLLDCQLEVIP